MKEAITRFLDINDRVMTRLTRDLRLGHVIWGVGAGMLVAEGDQQLAVPLLFTGFLGMVHGYIKDRQDGRL